MEEPWRRRRSPLSARHLILLAECANFRVTVKESSENGIGMVSCYQPDPGISAGHKVTLSLICISPVVVTVRCFGAPGILDFYFE